MHTIDGHDLYNMLQYGTSYVVNKRTKLNDINVFPVPDGDTGNNLVHTLMTISRESEASDSFCETLESISESALKGARGNSGIIFAQFINGLRLSCEQKDEVDMKDFMKMVNHSVTETYKALSNPVEGTMLTVIREWAEYLKKFLDLKKTMKQQFDEAYKHTETVLEQTKDMLDVLKDKNVVDSGAYGFVLFLEGISSYLNGDDIELIEYEEIELEDEHEFTDELTYRYCTEGLVQYKTFDEEQLKEKLNAIGDSLVFAKGKSSYRVHIHTNEPYKVFEILQDTGHIISQKADDMLLEMNMREKDRKRIVVTDSIADINPDLLEDSHLGVLPINITLNNTQYLDKLTINNEVLFNYIEEDVEYPTTATPTVKAINNLFMKLLLHYEEIIVISVASKLSATFQSIETEVNKLVANGKHIHLIDSLNNSVTQGLLVTKAVEMIHDGIETKQIVKTIKSMRHNTQILVCLETFKYAMKSGRLPKVVGKIGMAIRMRPIMSLDKNGKGSAFGFAFSQKGITKKIKKLVVKDMQDKGIKEYALVHCLNEELVQEYKELFTDIIGKEPKYITEISSATAIHSGKGSVAIGYITN